MDTESEAIKQLTYDNKITDNYKEDADECLKREFIDWLQGAHEDNVKQEASKNTRKAIFYKDGKVPGDTMEDWKPTWWGRHQLTHLPGVRPFLRNIRQNAAEQEFLLQQMAEFGPQNIEQAWQYFKYWVKGRQLGPEECVTPSYSHDAGFVDVELDDGTYGPKQRGQPYGPVERSTPIHMAKTREQILHPRQESRKRRMEEETAAESISRVPRQGSIKQGSERGRARCKRQESMKEAARTVASRVHSRVTSTRRRPPIPTFVSYCKS